MLEKLQRILRAEQVGSPLHAWALVQLQELEAQQPSAQDLQVRRLDVQVRNRSWQRREQNA